MSLNPDAMVFVPVSFFVFRLRFDAFKKLVLVYSGFSCFNDSVYRGEVW
jgi:hypothetical protein